MFQFLIGRLKTHFCWKLGNISCLVSIPYRQAQNKKVVDLPIPWLPLFQFLIGRLKTISAGSLGIFPVQFQFLIGRLKTKTPTTVFLICMLFQFLIGRLKTKQNAAKQFFLATFQFLIGRLKTHFPLFIASCRSRPNCQNSSLIHFPLARFY